MTRMRMTVMAAAAMPSSGPALMVWVQVFIDVPWAR